MSTIAVRGSRKTQVKEPKANGRGGQINAPPQLVEKTCPMCEAKFSLWLAPGDPGRNLCFECDPEPDGGRATNDDPDGKSKLTSKPAAAAKKTIDGSAEKALIDISVDVRKIEIVEQARHDFDEAKIEALAESIERDGLMQPPVVRHNPGNAAQPYRLVAGERRVRAVKKLGWSSVPVRLASGAIDDAQALLMQGEENVLREQFNDVELAQWCKLATSPAPGGGGLTQEQLAKRLGVTQAEISNRIRFLRCPAWALELVISGQMSRKHAMELLAFEDFEGLLKDIEKDVRQALKRDGELGTANEFRDLVHDTARRMTAAVEGADYRYELGGYVRYEIGAEDLKTLATVTVRMFDGKEETRAIDKKAAEKLLAAAKREALAKAEAKKKGKAKKAGGAEKKLSAAEQRKRDEQLEQQFKNRVEAWFYDWLRVLCAEGLTCPGPQAGKACTSFAFWGLLAAAPHGDDVASLFFGPKQPGVHEGAAMLKRLAELSDDELDAAGAGLAVGLLIDEEGQPRTPNWNGSPVPNDVVAALAALLNLDVAAAWRDDRRSPMRQKFWELHSKEQLLELGRELKVPLLESQKKSVMVNLLLGQEKPLPLPKALAGLAAKAAGGKAKKGTRSRGGAE